MIERHQNFDQDNQTERSCSMRLSITSYHPAEEDIPFVHVLESHCDRPVVRRKRRLAGLITAQGILLCTHRLLLGWKQCIHSYCRQGAMSGGSSGSIHQPTRLIAAAAQKDRLQTCSLSQPPRSNVRVKSLLFCTAVIRQGSCTLGLASEGEKLGELPRLRCERDHTITKIVNSPPGLARVPGKEPAMRLAKYQSWDCSLLR